MRFVRNADAVAEFENEEVRQLVQLYKDELQRLAVPHLNLEALNMTKVRWLSVSTIIAWLYGLVSLIVMHSLPDNRSSMTAKWTMYGFANSASLTCFAIATLDFVIRLVIHYCKTKQIQPHQILICVVMVVPLFMLGYTYQFWGSLRHAQASMDAGIDPTTAFERDLGIAAVQNQKLFSRLGLFLITLVFLFWYTILNVCQYYTIGILEHIDNLELLKREVGSRGTHTKMVQCTATTNSVDTGEEEVMQNDDKNGGYQKKHLFLKQIFNDFKERFFSMLCICNFQWYTDRTNVFNVLFHAISFRFWGIMLVWVAMRVSYTDYYTSICSTMPLVQIVTVLKVCSTKDPAIGINYCSPSHPGDGFVRALFLVGIFMADVLIFYMLYSRATKVLKVLKRAPYIYNRSNFLGFSFIMSTMPLMWVFALTLALIDTLSTNVEKYVTGIDGVDPLVFSGVTNFDYSMPFCWLIIMLFLLILAFAYLPPNSHSAFFYIRNRSKGVDNSSDEDIEVGNTDKDDQTTKHEEELEKYHSTSPLYLSAEQEFDQADDGSIIQLCCNELDPKRFPDYSDVPHEPVSDDRYNPEEAEKRLGQVRSQVLILDTEISMFNFAATAYCVKSKTREMTLAEEQALIVDDGFTIIKHVIDEESDTHALVLVSPDRVVVSFRGTASTSNVKTDLDYSWTVFEEACSVEPLAAPSLLAQPLLEREPNVHKGFLAAYRTVQKEIRDLVTPYILHSDDKVTPQKRALFVTGHSLGGALATLCSFDLAHFINSKTGSTPAVSCTTFGSPRVGCYSFSQRYKRLVPSCKRFVMANDMVPKTPPRLFTGLYHGYFHVGCEIIMDMDGIVLVAPNFVEGFVLHGFRRPVVRNHYCTRYCLGMILWATRMKTDADVWPQLVTRMVQSARNDIAERDQSLISSSSAFFKEGVVWRLRETEVTNTGVQASIEDITESEPLVPNTRHTMLNSFEQLEKELDRIKSSNGPISMEQIQTFALLVEQGKTNFIEYHDAPPKS